MDWLLSIELWAAITGLACVILAARENMWSYPIGIINVVLWIILFYQVKLYADVTLQIIFLILMAIGWYTWLTGKKNIKDVRKTREMTKKEILVSALIVIVGTPIMGYYYATWTDAALPYPDSFILVASLVAQWFLSRKVLESWVFWVLVDIVAVPLFLSRGLYITSGLYVLFLLNAFYGYFQWKKVMNIERSKAQRKHEWYA